MGADFSGYATKAGVKCSDGVTITPEAFKHMDGARVPLLWQHGHSKPSNVLGHAILEAREDGMYAYGYFNDTESGKNAKALVKHGDIRALSIYANELMKKASSVIHGKIKEISLVIAGANVGAFIDNVAIEHADGSTEEIDEAVISTGTPLEHEEGPGSSSSSADPTLEEVYNEFTEEQKEVVHYMIGAALEAAGAEHSDEGGEPKTVNEIYDAFNDDQKQVVHYMIGKTLKSAGVEHVDKEGTIVTNVFEKSALKHDDRPKLTPDQLRVIVEDAKKPGMTLKESFIAHADEYGIGNIDLLFPDYKTLMESPQFISRRMEWVSKVIDGVKKSPFARVKTMSADITHEEARAKGYIKGNLKKEEWFALTKRTTDPTTIYKKQKLDRDDIIDITDIDVVAWMKGEMRVMWEEELARGILLGDGRPVEDPENENEPNPDKIDESKLRPIAHDDDFYTHKIVVPSNVSGDGIVETVLRSRTFYRGSGSPTMFCSESFFLDMLLAKDKLTRRLYPTKADLEAALMVKEIVLVDPMESTTVNGGDLLAILVNLNDYNLGANRGGELAFFDDFDIDYNQYKYLYEGRCSGALTKFKSAIAYTRAAGTLVAPTVPTFNTETGVVTIPNVAGVTYTDRDTDTDLAPGAQTALDPGESLDVVASPNAGYYFPHNTDNDWLFTRPVV